MTILIFLSSKKVFNQVTIAIITEAINVATSKNATILTVSSSSQLYETEEALLVTTISREEVGLSTLNFMVWTSSNLFLS